MRVKTMSSQEQPDTIYVGSTTLHRCPTHGGHYLGECQRCTAERFTGDDPIAEYIPHVQIILDIAGSGVILLNGEIVPGVVHMSLLETAKGEMPLVQLVIGTDDLHVSLEGAKIERIEQSGAGASGEDDA